MSPSFNPDTKLFYVPTLEQCDMYTTTTAKAETLVGFAGGGGEQIPKEPGKFYLRAIDYTTGKRVWEYPMPGPGNMWAGTVSTAGGLVFFGDDDGNLVAVVLKSGRHLWHYATGQRMTASPMTFEVAREAVCVDLGGYRGVYVRPVRAPAKSVPVVNSGRSQIKATGWTSGIPAASGYQAGGGFFNALVSLLLRRSSAARSDRYAGRSR